MALYLLTCWSLNLSFSLDFTVYTFREIFTSCNLIFASDLCPFVNDRAVTLLFTPVFFFVAQLLVPRYHCRYTVLAFLCHLLQHAKNCAFYARIHVFHIILETLQLLPQTSDSKGNTACCLWVSDWIISCRVSSWTIWT